MTAHTAGPAAAPPIEGFDAGRWRALDGLTIDEPWQTLPDHVHRTSQGRPWPGLKVWHQVGPQGDLYVPPLGNHTILLRRGAATRLLQRQGNAVGECAWQRGTAVVVPTDTPSFWRSAVRRDNIHIDLAPIWLQRAAGGDSVVLDACFGRKDAVLSGFADLLLASLDSNVSLNPGFGEHLALGLAIHLIENYALAQGPTRAAATLSRRQMRLLGDAVHAELHGRWTVARLAALVDLSPFHFARAFKASFGATPHAWLQQRRMQEAARLVRETRQPLADIAAQTGHPSAAHFSQAFRRHWGVAPSIYRRAG
jgi:AraC family transcriptional regulator